MGLFGALFAGVSGLDSQSNKIGIISNNISNVNTVGFKQGQAAFDTLVVPSGTGTFSPGGVIGNTQQLVDQQGLIQATTSSTDAAITGGGFFVVNTSADGTGNTLLTRAGSFTQDALGNFVNSNNDYLQGIPITTPPTALNQVNLKTVNVSSSATGAATPTSLVTIAANFNAAQSVLLGSGEVATLAGDTANSQNTVGQIIVPTGASGNNLKAGDSFSITSVNAGKTDTFIYGGFSTGRDVTATIDTAAATAGEGDGATLLDTETVANAITAAGGNDQLTIALPNAADYSATSPNNILSISGVTGTVGGVAASAINGEWQVVSTGSGTVTFAVPGQTFTAVGGGTGGTAITASNRTTTSFTGNILNATTPGGDFLSGITNPASDFTTSALDFKIATSGGDTFTFQYNAASDPTQGQFNSLNSLATAINDSSNSQLTASVVNNRLYVSATDASEGLTFSNGDAVGNGLPTASGGLSGINWVQELDLPSTALANINAPAAASAFRFNTLSGLASQVNAADPTNLVATVSTGGAQTVSINVADPQSQVTFADATTNKGASLLNELGFTGAKGAALTSATNTSTGTSFTTTLPITYSAGSALTDMSSGAVTPQFTKDINIFDSLGNSHTVALNVAKIGVNTWAVELTVVPASALATVPGGTNDGQIASGVVVFNGDGTLATVKAQNNVAGDSIANPVTVNWSQSGPQAVGAAQSKFTVNLTGLIQSASAFNVSVASQNGSSVGELTGVSIDTNGFVVASFSNGQTQKIFQVPLASVNNPDGLEAVSGDAYQQTLASGQVNLEAAGTNGTGTITPSSLEQSNVDLSTQLTNLIVAQQAYGANSKVLTVADTLLQELDQIIQ